MLESSLLNQSQGYPCLVSQRTHLLAEKLHHLSLGSYQVFSNGIYSKLGMWPLLQNIFFSLSISACTDLKKNHFFCSCPSLTFQAVILITVAIGYPQAFCGLGSQARESGQPVVGKEQQRSTAALSKGCKSFQHIETFSEAAEVLGFAFKYLLVIFNVNKKSTKDSSLHLALPSLLTPQLKDLKKNIKNNIY